MRMDAYRFAVVRKSGFSLVELVTALAVSAILATLALPSGERLYRRHVVESSVNRLFASINHGRFEAIRSGQRTVLCPANGDGSACTGKTEWQRGWMLFVDANANRVLDAPDRLLRRDEGLPAGIMLNTTTGRTLLGYRPDGTPSWSNLTFTFCDPRGTAAPAAIMISMTGRARVSETNAAGEPLACPEG